VDMKAMPAGGDAGHGHLERGPLLALKDRDRADFSPTPVPETLLISTVTSCASANPPPIIITPPPPAASSRPSFHMTLSRRGAERQTTARAQKGALWLTQRLQRGSCLRAQPHPSTNGRSASRCRAR